MAGPCICKLGTNLEWVLGFLNSSIAGSTLGMLNPTLNMQARDIKSLPLLINDSLKASVNSLVGQCIELSKLDWNSLETSWDFKRHYLM